MTTNLPSPQIRIRKYTNRRLYDTSKSSYVTIEDLAAMVRAGSDFTVEDVATGQDLTRVTLVQIILEFENEGHDMLPIGVLRQLIQAYGERSEPILSRYLERVMIAFMRHQRHAEEALDQSLDKIHNTTATTAGHPNQSENLNSDMDIASLRAEFAQLKAKIDKIA